MSVLAIAFAVFSGALMFDSDAFPPPIPSAQQAPQGGYLGVFVELSPEGRGVVVVDVAENSPAMRNGLQVGDVVLGVGGRMVKTPEDLTQTIAAMPPGATVVLHILRDNRQRDIAARLTTRPTDFPTAPPGAGAPPSPYGTTPPRGATPPPPYGGTPPAPYGTTPQRGATPPPPPRGSTNTGIPPIPGQGPVSPVPTGKLAFRPTSVVDHELTRLNAYTFLSPVGWQVSSRIVWRNIPTDPAAPYIRVVNPTDGAEIGILPNLSFSWGPAIQMFFRQGDNYMGSEVHPVVIDPIQFIRTVLVPRQHPHLQQAQVVQSENLPRLAEAIAAKYPGVTNTGQINAGRVRFEYQEGGRPMETDIYAVVFAVTLQLSTSSSIYWGTEENRYVKAPKGKLDQLYPVFQTVSYSFRPTLEFFNRRQQLVDMFVQMDAQRGRQAVEAAMNSARDNPVLALSKYIARTNDSVSAGIRQSYEYKSSVNDRVNQNWSYRTRGVDGYTNPWTGYQTQLPAGYREAWVAANGEYVLSNDPGYDPNVGSTITYQRMPKQQ